MAPLFVGSNSDDSRIRSDRVGLAASTSNPASADTGDVYYNSTDNKLNVYDGSDWAEAGGGGTLSGIASGTIPNGATVIINTDGTVSAVTETITNALNPGSSVVFESATTGTSGGAAYDSANQKVVIVYRDSGNSSQGTAVVGTVSGNSISFGTPVVFETGTTTESRVVYDSTNEKVVIAFMDDYGKAVVGTVSGTSISFGSITTFESATLSNLEMAYDSSNQRVVIIWRKNDGVDFYGWSIVGTVSGTSISFGTKVVFYNGGTIYDYKIAYDSSNQKVVIAYKAGGNSDYGTAIVGTVSGTSISYGTSVVYESAASSYNAIVYDSSNQKVVIAYRDGGNSSYGTAVVGTVSGTSISFGSATVFESANSSDFAATFDSTNNKVVVAYADGGNSSYGTAVVGTVSGTDISFGTPVVFESASISHTTATFDSVNGKVVIAYQDQGNSNYGTVIVGTVSGTSISFGTAVVFNSSSTSEISAIYDSSKEKVVISYRSNGNSNYGTAIVGTVSGTSISFGSEFTFESASTEKISSTYDSTNGKAVVAYQDGGNSSYGTAAVIATDTLETNLTAENFIGFSDAAYSNGATANIQIISSIDDAQSGLTTGSKFYVQNDGTLGTTAGDPSVFAGTAVSGTEILIKQ